MKNSIGAYVYPPSVDWSGGLIWLKYYNVLKRQITFTLRLNADKNNDYMEKRFK